MTSRAVRSFTFHLLLLFSSGVFCHADERAAEIAASLDDSALAAQTLLAGIDGKGALSPTMRSLFEKIPVGGVMFFKYNLDTSKDGVRKLLSGAASVITTKTNVPPFMAADHEGGLVHRFGPGVAKLPAAFSFWELSQNEGRAAALVRAENLYVSSAKEIRELGINMVLGPVAEILNEDNRLFLETRSYGSDSDFTLAAASAFIKSMNAEGIACVVKHFPGNTSADPHTGTSTLNADKAGLDEMVKPFAKIIRDMRPHAVMVSHVTVPALDDQRNASLSRAVIEDWLRGELGFDGIVLADDFSMAAVTSSGMSPAEAAVEALNAGVDMIMTWPRNVTAVHTAILDALNEGRLSRRPVSRHVRRSCFAAMSLSCRLRR
jgi:beta-N-acetylhexosaminidase